MDNELLKDKQKEISSRLIPAVAPTAIITIVGIVGNILTIVFFSRKSKPTVPVVLIKYLAGSDLATCTVAISIIFEMILNVRYNPKALVLCKVSHFLGNWTIGASWAFLSFINIDRYRKICHPLGRQIPVSSLKYIGIGVVTFFLLTSVRLLLTFDVMEVNVTISNSNHTNEFVTGFHCAASCDGDYTALCFVFYFIDFTGIVAGFIVAIILYSRIIYTLIKRRYQLSRKARAEKHDSKLRSRSTDDSSFRSPNEIDAKPPVTVMKMESSIEETETPFNKIQLQDEETKPEKSKTESQKERSASKHSRTESEPTSTGFDFCSVRMKPVEWNITLMMFATTVVFIFCFIPYFGIRILFRLVLKADEENNYNSIIQFSLKLPYLNSAANPIIYCIFNRKFRRFVGNLFSRCCRK